jgi:hypothetical protein
MSSGLLRLGPRLHSGVNARAQGFAAFVPRALTLPPSIGRNDNVHRGCAGVADGICRGIGHRIDSERLILR